LVTLEPIDHKTTNRVSVSFSNHILAAYIYVFYSPKTAANTKTTKEKAEHMQIAIMRSFR